MSAKKPSSKGAYTIVADRGQLGPEARDWLLLGFAIIGVALSVGAWMMQRGDTLVGCTLEDIQRGRCLAVLLPVFASHFGFPIAWLGMAGYGLIALFSAAVVVTRPRKAEQTVALNRWRTLLGIRRWLILGAFGFSVYFSWFQALFIGEFCPVCLSSAATSFALLVVELKRPNTIHLATRKGLWWPRRQTLLATLAVFALVSVGSLILSEVWHPLAKAEQAKRELFERYEPAPAGPLYSRHQEKPTLILGSKDGCPVCTYYFGDLLQDPRVQALLDHYIVYVGELSAGRPVVMDERRIAMRYWERMFIVSSVFEQVKGMVRDMIGQEIHFDWEIGGDRGALIRSWVSWVPALAIVDGVESARSISGMRPLEEIIDFLSGDDPRRLPD